VRECIAVTDTSGRFDYPVAVRAELQRLGDETLDLLDRDPSGAKERARSQLAVIEDAERQVGHGLHKGQAFYNIGVAEAVRNVEAARAWFLAAHIEDARSSAPDAPPGQPAAATLGVVYGYGEAELLGRADRARSDLDVSPFKFALLLTSEGTTDPLKLPFDQPGDEPALERTSPGDRVFVGGSYRFGWPTLVTIARGVRKAGMTPVVVQTFPDRAGEDNRAKSFRFLHMCRSAVFDGTLDGGWEQEISEIARDPIPSLVVYGADEETRKPSHTTMLPGRDEIPGLQVLPFIQHEELPAIVARWLAEKVSRPDSLRGGPRYVYPLTAEGSATQDLALGSNTRFAGGYESAESDVAVGSGGDYLPQPTSDELAMESARRALERLQRPDDKPGLGPTNDDETSR
jgi:hypothetical protein